VNEINKLAENFKKDFDKLMNFQNNLLSQIPDQYAKQRAEIQNDMETVLSAVKKNDLSSLNTLIKKYANNDNR
jgi:hypothetical protein